MIRREGRDEHLHAGHRSRMRRKLVNYGAQIFEDYELLEILLFSAIRNGDTNPQAKRLMARFRDISSLIHAKRCEITSVEGIGERSAELIECLAEIESMLAPRSSASGRIIDGMQTAGEIAVRHFSGCRISRISALFIDNSMRFIGIYDLFDCDYSSARVVPQKFIDLSLRLNAAAVIVMHNHPYGPLFASEGDLETDKLINRALDTIGVLALEHIIVSGSDYIGITGRRSLTFMQDPFIRDFLERRARAHAISELFDHASDPSLTTACEEEIVRPLTKLLSFTHKADEAQRIASGLIFRYGCLSSVLSLSVADMLAGSEATLQDAVTLRVAGALLSRSVTQKFNFNARHTEDEIADYLKALFLGEGAEKLYALFCRDGKVSAPVLLSEGAINNVSVTPRMLIDQASLAGAHEIILAHNHPGGVPRASADDRTMTALLNNTLMEVGMRIVLHYVVADGQYDLIRS